MKKLFVFLLAFIMVFSFAACSGGGDQDDGGAGGASSTNLVDWIKAGEFYIEYTMKMVMDDIGDGMNVETKGIMACQNERAAMTAEMDFLGQSVNVHIIKNGDKAYQLDEATKTYREMTIDANRSINARIPVNGSMERTGAGEGEVEGKILPYEEYITDEGTIRFYLDDGQVYALESEAEGVKAVVLITKASDKTPDGMFDLPEGYTKQELSQ